MKIQIIKKGTVNAKPVNYCEILVDDTGAIRFWNAAGEQLFGVAAEWAVGRQAGNVVPDYDRLVEAAHRQERFVPVRIADVMIQLSFTRIICSECRFSPSTCQFARTCCHRQAR